jgi:hypothetical protein
VPFFRVGDDDEDLRALAKVKGLVRQQAFKKLKGGEGASRRPDGEHAAQLVAPPLRRRSRTRRRSQVLTAAEKLAASPEAGRVAMGQEGRDLRDGQTEQKVHYAVDDPFMLSAISAIESASFKGLPMKVMGKFKHYLTMGVTPRPTFRSAT